MSEPRKCIPHNQEQREVIPPAGQDKPDEQQNAQRRTDEMQKSGREFRMFLHVEIPKFAVAVDHGGFAPDHIRIEAKTTLRNLSGRTLL